jgi:hypothetical protein
VYLSDAFSFCSCYLPITNLPPPVLPLFLVTLARALSLSLFV